MATNSDMHDLPKELHAAIQEALDMYGQHHRMTAAITAEARNDFIRFYVEAIMRSCPGIRWNFNGCIMCPDGDPGPKLAARILIGSPVVLAQTGGRPLGTTLCLEHHQALPRVFEPLQVLDQAALRRIRRDPVP